MLKDNFLIHFVWQCTAPNFEVFYTAWRKCLRRIDGLPNKTHKIILPALWDVKTIHVKLHKSIVNFVNKNAKTENEIIKIKIGSSAVSNSDSHISFLYNISRHNVLKFKHLLHITLQKQRKFV